MGKRGAIGAKFPAPSNSEAVRGNRRIYYRKPLLSCEVDLFGRRVNLHPANRAAVASWRMVFFGGLSYGRSREAGGR